MRSHNTEKSFGRATITKTEEEKNCLHLSLASIIVEWIDLFDVDKYENSGNITTNKTMFSAIKKMKSFPVCEWLPIIGKKTLFLQIKIIARCNNEAGAMLKIKNRKTPFSLWTNYIIL